MRHHTTARIERVLWDKKGFVSRLTSEIQQPWRLFSLPSPSNPEGLLFDLCRCQQTCGDENSSTVDEKWLILISFTGRVCG